MGYSTEFKGEFKTDKPVDAETIDELNLVMGFDAPMRGKDGVPDEYCQWELQKDRQTIKWDGNEKFYGYIDCLKMLIDRVLKPRGYVVSGLVNWVGEDSFDDRGTITVSNNTVSVISTHLPTVTCPSCNERFVIK